MSRFTFSKRSLDNLKGIHPRLVEITHRALALTEVDFVVIEGLRTLERQKKLMASGASRTLDSRHLTGHAIDVAAYVDGDIRWDWPLYPKIARAFTDAAGATGEDKEGWRDLVWGGSWPTFRDGPHFELDRVRFPVSAWTTPPKVKLTPQMIQKAHQAYLQHPHINGAMEAALRATEIFE